MARERWRPVRCATVEQRRVQPAEHGCIPNKWQVAGPVLAGEACIHSNIRQPFTGAFPATSLPERLHLPHHTPHRTPPRWAGRPAPCILPRPQGHAPPPQQGHAPPPQHARAAPAACTRRPRSMLLVAACTRCTPVTAPPRPLRSTTRRVPGRRTPGRRTHALPCVRGRVICTRPPPRCSTAHARQQARHVTPGHRRKLRRSVTR
jgi:hypothetical protein